MIKVLRLGHRRERDARVTTHVALTARAFGADGIIVSEKDARLESTIKDVVGRFGGPFTISTGAAWRPLVRRWKAAGGQVVHLTMYGEDFEEGLATIPKKADVLLVVGAEKVPGELYRLADRNLAVGNQPHSEVAALALTLDRLSRGRWKRARFAGSMQIVPSARGKTIIDKSRSR